MRLFWSGHLNRLFPYSNSFFRGVHICTTVGNGTVMRFGHELWITLDINFGYCIEWVVRLSKKYTVLSYYSYNFGGIVVVGAFAMCWSDRTLRGRYQNCIFKNFTYQPSFSAYSHSSLGFGRWESIVCICQTPSRASWDPL